MISVLLFSSTDSIHTSLNHLGKRIRSCLNSTRQVGCESTFRMAKEHQAVESHYYATVKVSVCINQSAYQMVKQCLKLTPLRALRRRHWMGLSFCNFPASTLRVWPFSYKHICLQAGLEKASYKLVCFDHIDTVCSKICRKTH